MTLSIQALADALDAEFDDAGDDFDDAEDDFDDDDDDAGDDDDDAEGGGLQSDSREDADAAAADEDGAETTTKHHPKNFSRIDIHQPREEIEKEFPGVASATQTFVEVHAGEWG